MANLNQHDSVFLESPEFIGLKKGLENAYGFLIKGVEMPEHVSFTTRKLILSTSGGQFFLKEKPVYASTPDRLLFAADYQNWLSSELAFVCKLQSTDATGSYFEWNQRQYHLTPFRSGRIYNGSLADLTQALSAIEDLRNASAKYQPSTCSNQIDSPVNILPFSVYSHKINTREDKDVAERIEALRVVLTQKYDLLPKEYHACHGDMSIFNFLFKDTEVLALHDFDNAAMMPTVQDVSEFIVSCTLVNYIAPLSNQKYPVLLHPSPSSFQTILAWCRERDLFSYDEKRLMAVICEIAWLDQLVLTLVRGDYQSSDLSPALEKLEEESLYHAVERQLSVGS